MGCIQCKNAVSTVYDRSTGDKPKNHEGEEGERFAAAATGASIIRMETVHKHEMIGLLIPTASALKGTRLILIQTVPVPPASNYRSSTYFVAVCSSSSALRENPRFSRQVSLELICLVEQLHLIFLTASSYKWHRDKNS